MGDDIAMVLLFYLSMDPSYRSFAKVDPHGALPPARWDRTMRCRASWKRWGQMFLETAG